MPDGLRLVWIGLVDDYGECHELQIPADKLTGARLYGWMVLDDEIQGMSPFNGAGRAADTAEPR